MQPTNCCFVALFQGELGRQHSEIHFKPATGIVTMKLLVQDPNGYCIPNVRRENLAVCENGIPLRVAAGATASAASHAQSNEEKRQ